MGRLTGDQAPFRAVLFSALLLLAVVHPRSSHANTTVDLIVDALVVPGAVYQITVGETEKQIIKQVVGDIVDGMSPADALKKAVLAPLINGLPPQAQALATCVAGGTPVATCALNELPRPVRDCVTSGATGCAISALPEESRPFAQCLAEKKPAAVCARDEAIRRLPDEDARKAADCLARTSKVAGCAKGAAQIALGKLENVARDQTDPLFKPAASSLQNLINLAFALDRGDWPEVVANGGAAVAKHIIKKTLTAVAPIMMPWAGDLVDAVVDRRIDLATDLINAAKSGDIPQLTRIVVEGYLTLQVEMHCELPLIPQVIRDAICGPLGKLIRAVAGAAGDVTSDVVDLVKLMFDDPLSVPGEAWRRLTKDSDCGTSGRYYSQRFAMCYAGGVSIRITGKATNDIPVSYREYEEALSKQCRLYFQQCFTSPSDYDAICNPMRDVYRAHTEKAHAAVLGAAHGYRGELQHFIQSHAQEACAFGIGGGRVRENWIDAGYRRFVGECGSAVENQIPLGPVNTVFFPEEEAMITPGVAAPNCTRGPGASMTLSTAPLVGDQACEKAISRAEFVDAANSICRKTLIIPPGASGPIVEPCKWFERRVDGKCVAIPVAGLPTAVSPRRDTPSTILFVDPPKLPLASCEGGRLLGSVCHCPLGQQAVSFTGRIICMNSEGGSPQGTTLFPGGGAGNARTGGFDGTACADNQVRNASGICQCAAGTVWNGNRCVAGGTATSTPPSGGGFDGVAGAKCASNLVRTLQGDCVCRTGTVWTGNSCVPGGTAVSRQPPTCPAGMLGTPPNCYHVPPASGGGFDTSRQALPGIVFGGRPTININPGGGRQTINVNPGGNTPRSTGAPTQVQGTPRVGDAAPSAGTAVAAPTPLPSGGRRLGRSRPAPSDHQEFGGGYYIPPAPQSVK